MKFIKSALIAIIIFLLINFWIYEWNIKSSLEGAIKQQFFSLL